MNTLRGGSNLIDEAESPQKMITGRPPQEEADRTLADEGEQ